MSHITGTVQPVSPPMTIVPGTINFNPVQAPLGTKLLMLHFQNANFLPGDQLQVNLGYDVDVFTAASGPAFWTRPINVYAFPGGVPITYVPAGPPGGSVQLDQFGRGERHNGEPNQPQPGFSNCDPFYQGPAYEEPKYDPFWYCNEPPHWDNVACIMPSTDVRARVARSCGMIVTAESSIVTGILQLSTCSVTLVDADKVICAGHCHTPEEALSSSVTFDYQTQCDGTQPPGYNPRFYKVIKVLGHKNIGTSLDYSLMQLAEAPAGIPIIQMRPTLPAVGESVFEIHHPNGAVKKVSPPVASGFANVSGSSNSGITVPVGFAVSGGSSGSGLFDTAGRLVGVLSRGDRCEAPTPLTWCPAPNIIADLIPTPPPPITRDVMLVIDRSGSMSMDDGTGRAKIDAARDAASLFVQLVKAGTGNRDGLVSFSTTASLDFAIAPVTNATKQTLIGPPPFSGGLVGGLVPGGNTTIGGGLDMARGQFPSPGANPRAILLLTDGLQNTAPMIADVDPGLAGITVHAIGLGTESSLDGALLTSLATSHGGLYFRAGGGLSLEKFFSSAFGNIFEAGILFDPEFDLPANQTKGDPVPFRVCGEETITAVVGWDRTDASLFLEVTTPAGAVITAGSATTESSTGVTWSFLRIPLPIGGERNGLWKVNVARPGGDGEIQPPMPALRYFLNVIPLGGPKILLSSETKRYYTGDRINPMVMVRQENGGWPDNLQVSLTVTRPDTSVGNVLSASGLGTPAIIGGDGIPARQSTLQAIEKSSGKPVSKYVDLTFDLSDDPINNGSFESGGSFGKPFDDLLVVEGNYSFHAKATYGTDCAGMREATWSLHVDVGIDSGKTTVTTTSLPPGPDGSNRVRFTFTPRDKYGNLLGPGRGDSFTVEPQPGSTPDGPVTDLGNGSYTVDVSMDPNSLEPPRVGIVQPGRPPVVIGPARFTIFAYSVKFVCGEQKADCCGCTPVRPGHYSTEINIHNAGEKQTPVLKRVIPLVLAGAVVGREPNVKTPATLERLSLPAHTATMDDCCRILEMTLGAPPSGPTLLTIGILDILSLEELSVTAVYTASRGSDSAPSIDVQQVASRVIVI
jgi:hypothetical protein